MFVVQLAGQWWIPTTNMVFILRSDTLKPVEMCEGVASVQPVTGLVQSKVCRLLNPRKVNVQ